MTRKTEKSNTDTIKYGILVVTGVPTEKQVLVSRVYSLGRVDRREAEDLLLTITERTGYNLATVGVEGARCV